MPKARPLEELFWSNVAVREPNECWPWTRSVNRTGYGKLTRPKGASPKRHLLSHRVAYELAQGPIPDGLLVLHRCDNPPCCNPAHLWVGTHADNVADMHAKGRARSRDSYARNANRS